MLLLENNYRINVFEFVRPYDFEKTHDTIDK